MGILFSESEFDDISIYLILWVLIYFLIQESWPGLKVLLTVCKNMAEIMWN